MGTEADGEHEEVVVVGLKEGLLLSTRDLERRVWEHDSTHLGFVMTPLFQSFVAPALSCGIAEADRRLGLPERFYEARIYHDYYYEAEDAVDLDPDGEAGVCLAAGLAEIRREFDRIVAEELLPRYRELMALADSVRTGSEAVCALDQAVAIYDAVWTLHMEIVRPVFFAQASFERVFLQLFAGRAPVEAHALLAGGSNQFVEADRRLAELAQTAAGVPALRRAICAPDPMAALSGLPEAGSFLGEIGATIECYGWRAGASQDFYGKTWREDPRPLFSALAGFLARPETFETHWQRVVADHERVLRATLEAISGDADRLRFRTAFERAWAARPLNEDHHFYIDAMLPAKTRPLLLKIGEMLVRACHLASVDDVFFLYRDEVRDLLVGSARVSRETILDRRADYRRHSREAPPACLGKGLSPDRPESGPVGSDLRRLSGLTASPGVGRGVVRMVRGPEDFSRVKPGDVLIARTTTPVWSALFAIAGAVVTDAGGILSHAATVAREYHVPCVVATKWATRVFREGDLVEVDGDRGLVTLECR